MNWTAATAALLCSAAAGFRAAAKRTGRLKALQVLVLLLQRVRLELSFSREFLPDMLSRLQREAPFASFRALQSCNAALKDGDSLREAWQKGAKTLQGFLSAWETTRLCQLGAVLGATDLAGQQQALCETLSILEQSLRGAAQSTRSAAALCRACGVCAGCVLFIMIL